MPRLYPIAFMVSTIASLTVSPHAAASPTLWSLPAAADVAPPDDDGCDCSVAGRSDASSVWLLGGALGVLLLLRRRR